MAEQAPYYAFLAVRRARMARLGAPRLRAAEPCSLARPSLDADCAAIREADAVEAERERERKLRVAQALRAADRAERRRPKRWAA